MTDAAAAGVPPALEFALADGADLGLSSTLAVLEAAAESGDVAGVVGCYAADAVRICVDGTVVRGADAIAAVAIADAAAGPIGFVRVLAAMPGADGTSRPGAGAFVAFRGDDPVAALVTFDDAGRIVRDVRHRGGA